MKFQKIIRIIAIAIISIQLIGCTTNEKFTVVAPTGSNIYTPYQMSTPIATTRNSGRAEIAIPSDMYCGYLLVRAPGNGVLIPMGLDYKHSSHMGAKAALVTGATLTAAGVGTAVVGSIAMIAASANSDDDNTSTMGMIAAVGAGVGLIGASFGYPSQSRLRQTAYDYNFGYNKIQTFKMPQLAFQLKNPNPTKEQLASPAKSTTRKKATSGGTPKADNTKKSSGTKAKKLKSNISSNIIGVYKGSGELLLDNNTEESYSEIIAIIEQVDKNHVTIKISESGEDFFESNLSFLVKKGKNGSFDIMMEDLPEVTGSISKSGVLTLSHPQVNIDGDIYTLIINVQK